MSETPQQHLRGVAKVEPMMQFMRIYHSQEVELADKAPHHDSAARDVPQAVMGAAERVVSEWRSSGDLYPDERLRRLSGVIHDLDMTGRFSMFAKAN